MNNDSNSPGKHLRKGVIWTLFYRTSVVAMQFLAMIVLARFISPSEFAIMGIAIFFISISQSLLDSGMGGSLLRKQNIEDIDYSTLFIFNMVVGILMYILLLIFAKPIASFYNYEGLSLIINVIGISIVISAFGKIQNIILLREFKFKEISIISIVSSLVALLIAILMAVKGYGVWALVIQNLVNGSLIVILQFFYNRYFPKLRFSTYSFREQWDYGSHLLYSNILNTIYQNVFLMIFPKISSYTFSGLYAQATKIQQIPYNIINPVVHGSIFPVLAKINDEKLFIQTTKDSTRKVYVVSFIILLALFVFSKQSIVILLGEKWIGVSPILSLLSIGSIGVIVSMMVRNTMKSMGITNNIFKLEIIKSLIGIVILLATFVFGDFYILLGIVIANFLSAFIAIYYLAKVSKFTIKGQFKDFIISLMPVVPSTVISYLFVTYTSLGNFLTLLIGLFIYLLSVMFFGVVFRNNEIINTQRFILTKLGL